MSIFNIDKNVQPGNVVASTIKSEFRVKMGTTPENKVRMGFRDLTTIEGGRLPDIELYMDPQSVQVTKNVRQTPTQTKGGWVTQFWGHELTQVSVNANSGNYEPIYGMSLEIPPNSSTLDRWAKGGGPLKIFEKLKERAFSKRHDYQQPWRGNPIITLVWEESSYKGYFTNFNYNVNSQTPFNISYNFNFIVLSREDMGLSDIFGATDSKSAIADPMGTVVQKTKTLTSVGVSWARRTTSKLINETPYANKVNSYLDVIDDLPNKLTLW